MVERQASKLRAGIQDDEEPLPSDHDGADQAAIRIQALEQECDALSAQLAARGRELKRHDQAAIAAATKEITGKFEQSQRSLADLQARYTQLDNQLHADKVEIDRLQTQLSITSAAAAAKAATRRRWWHRS